MQCERFKQTKRDQLPLYCHDVRLAWRMQPLGFSTGSLRSLVHTQRAEAYQQELPHNLRGCMESVTHLDGTRESHCDPFANPEEMEHSANPIASEGVQTPSESFVRSFGLRRELEGHNGCVNSLSMNASGELLLSGSDDLAFCLYDTFEWQIKQRYRTRHSSNIFHAVFVPGNDHHVVSCARDGRTLVTDLEVGESFYKCRHSQVASSIAVSPWWPDTAYVGYLNGFISRIDTRTRRLESERTTDGNPCLPSVGEVRTLAVHDRWPFLLASGTNTEAVYLHDVRMCSLGAFAAITIPCVRRSNGVSGLSFSANGTSLAVNYREEHVYVVPWLETLYSRSVSTSASRNATCTGFSSVLDMGAVDKLTVATADGAVKMSGRRNVQTMFKDVTFMEDDSIVCSGCDSGNVFFWRTSDGKLIHTTPGDASIVNVVLYSHRTGRLLTSGIDDTIKVLGPLNGRVSQSIEHREEVEDTFSRSVVGVVDTVRRILLGEIPSTRGDRLSEILSLGDNLVTRTPDTEDRTDVRVELNTTVSDDSDDDGGGSVDDFDSHYEDESNEEVGQYQSQDRIWHVNFSRSHVEASLEQFAAAERALHMSLTDLILLTRQLVATWVFGSRRVVGGIGTVPPLFLANGAMSSTTAESDAFSRIRGMVVEGAEDDGDVDVDDMITDDATALSSARMSLPEDTSNLGDSIDRHVGSDSGVSSASGNGEDDPFLVIGTSILTPATERHISHIRAADEGTLVEELPVVGGGPGQREERGDSTSQRTGDDRNEAAIPGTDVMGTVSSWFQDMHRVFNKLRDGLKTTFRRWTLPGGGRVQIPRWDRCTFGVASGAPVVDGGWSPSQAPDVDDDTSFLFYYASGVAQAESSGNVPAAPPTFDAFLSNKQRIRCFLTLLDVVLRRKELICSSTEERRGYWMFRCVTELCYAYYFMALGEAEAAIHHVEQLERHAEYRCITALGSVDSACLRLGGKRRRQAPVPQGTGSRGTYERRGTELLRTLDCGELPPLLVPMALKIRILVLSQRGVVSGEDVLSSGSCSDHGELLRDQAGDSYLQSLVNEMRGRLSGHPNEKVKQRVVRMLRGINITLS
ncbi:WD domain [Trypanosoma brucei equiperdum]|uniref:WD domain n=1 Tax=Trypanosoma brucei equiperdum TaxID=630700 RepID=A0A3L6L448_9TRYP|nr:WD domain [Trypanosoma brucei equiperdum]